MSHGHWLARIVALALLLPAAVSAGEVTIGSGGSYPLSQQFSYLIDASQQLTLEDLQQPAQQARFQPLPAAGPGANFGFNTAAIWLRVTLLPGAGTLRDWLLEVAYPPLDYLDSIRDSVYLIYALFVAGMALFQAALTGFGFQFLWPGQTWWNIHSPPFGTIMAGVFGLLFARTFLSNAVRSVDQQIDAACGITIRARATSWFRGPCCCWASWCWLCTTWACWGRTS